MPIIYIYKISKELSTVPHLTLIDVLTEVLAGVSLVTGAGVGPLQVDAVSVATYVLHLTLVNIQAGPGILLEPEARPAAALHRPPLECDRQDKVPASPAQPRPPPTPTLFMHICWHNPLSSEHSSISSHVFPSLRVENIAVSRAAG